MNNVRITKANGGKGWFIYIEDVIADAPLTSLELWSIYKVIKDNLKIIEKEIEEEAEY